ncbi:CotH kinase family protein [Maribacter chungangensis]|uniref:CotH kinase family protein n=1 Tax=Maribacter chungangensis TaxID=1069117 RepID=A0ABW3B163_9FLAO
MKIASTLIVLVGRYLTVVFLVLLCINCSSEDPPIPPPDDEETESTEIPPEDKLPMFAISTNGNQIVDEPKNDATFTVTEGNVVSHEGRMGIEIRGASSQLFPKKSFGFETRDAANEDLDVSLLGYPEEEDWILYAPYSDKSLLRNMLIYDLSRDIGQYASRTKFVEVTIDEAYQGVYVFMEKLKRDSGRIDINNLKEDENSGDDLTGGYILKIDKTAGSNLGEGYNDQNSFASTISPPNAVNGQEINFMYEDPDAEDITTEQKTYITNYVGQFEAALASDSFTDPETGYAAFIDVDSFIDFFILNELSNNVDGYRLSTYMHKDKNEKLKMGPIWDFNLAFGNADYCSGGTTNVWAYKFNERCPEDFWQVPFWWERLLQDPAYVSKLKARWGQLRGSSLSNGAILSKLDTYTTVLNTSGAAENNFRKWPVLGTYIWPNNFVGNTYAEELDYLTNWIEDRLLWMDAEIEGL